MNPFVNPFEESPTPKFKKGDKVRVIDTDSSFYNNVGIIKNCSRNGNFRVAEEGEYWLYLINWISRHGDNVLYERRLTKERELKITIVRKQTQKGE